MRVLKYKEAISEGLCQAMEKDDSIFVCGIGVDYSSYIFGTTKEAKQRWPDRVIDTPAMENALTGICIGAAAMGKRPVLVHARADFSFLAFDQLVNLAAKWKYMYGGNAGSVPVVTRMIIGRGWGQGATHSQSVHSLLAHYPGLAVVMPSNALTARGMLCAALIADHPTVILEHRSLYEIEGVVEEVFDFPGSWNFGEAEVVREASDLTIVATSFMVEEAKRAADILGKIGVQVEIVDPVSIRPLDEQTILESVRKTGHLLVCDVSHELCGFASEVCALAAEKAFSSLKSAPRRLTLPDCPCPTAHSLEEAFYPKPSTIAALVLDMLGIEAPADLVSADKADTFKGPY